MNAKRISFKKPIRSLALILVGFTSVCILAVISSYVYYYVDSFLLPTEPEASGAFPSKPVWTFDANDRIVSTPVVQEAKIFIRTLHYLVAIDALNGKPIWTERSDVPTGLSLGNITIAPLVIGPIVIVPEKGSVVAAYSMDTGEVKWKTNELDANIKNPMIASIESYAVGGDRLYVARFSWTLSAYDLATGNLLWEKNVPNKASLHIEADEKNIFISGSMVLQRLDPDTGEVIWEASYDSLVSTFLLGVQTLYVALPFGEESLLAFDIDSRELIWSIGGEKFGDDELRNLTLDGDVLYAGGNRLFAISAVNGSIHWVSEDTGRLEQPIFMDTRLVIARNREKRVFIFDAITGEQLGYLTVKPNSPMKHEPDRGPAIFNDLIIIPFGDNRVMAYRP